MTRAYLVALLTFLLIAAASWRSHPDHVPQWYDDMCAQVHCPKPGSSK